MKIKKLAWMILLTLLSVCASADTAIVDGITWTYTVKNGQASVGGGTEATPAVPRTTTGAIVIPSTLDSYPVTAVSVYAFDNCYALTSIMIPESVTSIGDYAFYGCSALTSVPIPASVTNIGGVLFSQCAKLSEIEVDAENPSYAAKDGILYDKSMTALLQCLQTRKTVTIPGSVTSVGDKAFYGSSALTSLTIPEGVTNIGVMAFYGCDKLMSVMYGGDAPITVGTSIYGSTPSSLTTYVRSGTRGWNGNSQSTIIPQSWPVGDADARPIVAVPAQSTVTFDLGGHATRTGGGELTQTVAAMDAAVAPEIAANAGWAFMGWDKPFDCVISNLTVTAQYESTMPTNGVYKEVVDGLEWTYVISNGEASVGGETSDKTAVPKDTAGEIEIPVTLGGCPVKEIASSAFYGCTNLNSVTMPEGVTSVGNYAFRYCSSLTSVTISSSVTSIGYLAFDNCASLTTVTIPSSVTSIGDDPFLNCKTLEEINVASSNPSYASQDGILYDKSMTTLIQCPGARTSVTIHSGVTSIACGSFCGCEALTSVTIPEGVTNIGYEAFLGCLSLKSVKIPSSVTIIDGWAFMGCRSLTSVIIPEGLTMLCNWAFSDCTSLRSVCFKGDAPRLDYVSTPGVQTGCCIYEGSYPTTYVVEGTKGWSGNYESTLIPQKWPINDGYSARPIVAVPAECAVTFDLGGHATRIGGGELEQTVAAMDAAVEPEIKTNAGYTFTGWSDPFDCVISNLTVTALYESTVPTNGVYTEGVDGVEWTYTIKDGEASVGGGSSSGRAVAKSLAGDVEIPAVLGGCPVKEIALFAFDGCTNLTSVTIPEGVTSIDSYAFDGCSSLMSVTIPSSVTSIGDHAFFCCSSLTSVTIPEGVTSIGDYAFGGCTAMDEIKVVESNPSYASQDGILYDKSMTILIRCPAARAAATVTIPASVMSIACGSFSGCEALTSVIIPEGVTNIGWGAFMGCPSLKSVKIPSSVTIIEGSAFDGSGSLRSVCFKGDAPRLDYNASDGEYIGDCFIYYNSYPTTYVVEGTKGWSGNYESTLIPQKWPINDGYSARPIVAVPAQSTVTFDLGGHATRIGGGELTQTVAAFDAAVEPEIAANAGYTFTGWSDSFDCVISNLTVTALYDYATPTNGTYTELVDGLEWTFVISNGVASVGGGVNGMTAVPEDTTGEIEIPVTLGGCPVTGIGNYAFYRCNSLTLVTIHDGITSIGERAFYYCSKLGSVTIPSSVTNWVSEAFAYSGLTNVVFSEGLTSIGQSAFSDCSELGSVTIPSSVTNWGIDAFERSGLTNVVFSEGLTSIGKRAFYSCSKLGSVTIPSSVTDWGIDAFRYSGLTNVVFSEGLTSIGESAFYMCEDLQTVSIAGSVTKIGDFAFYYCDSLTSLTIPEGVTSIGSGAFTYGSLKSVTIPESVTNIGDSAFYYCPLTSVTIPKGVTSIGNSVFSYCDIEMLTIPDGVTSIGNSAFYGCDDLISVTIPESVTNIGDNAFGYCCSLETITIPEGVLNIGEGVFSSCHSLVSVMIPEGVTNIGLRAFQGCTNLTAVTLPESVASIGGYAFSSCSALEEITIHKGVTSIDADAFANCDNLATVYCDAGDSARVSDLLANSGFDVSKLTFITPQVTAEDIEKVYDGVPTNFVVTVAGVQEGVTTHVAYSLDGATYAPESPAFTDVLRDTEGNVLTQKVWYIASADNGTLNVTNFATVAVLPRPVEVEIVGHTNTVVYTGEPQSVEGYEQTFEDDLYNADWIDFSGEARVEVTAVGKYDMGLKAEDFENTNANFAVSFGVTDGWLAITNGTILANASNATKVYDGEATNIAVSVTVPAEGAAVSFRTEEGEWTAAAEFAGIADAGTNKVWYLVEATGYTAVSNFAYVVIEPRMVEVAIAGHTNMVAFTGEKQYVEGYEVAFEDDLYNADWIDFSGEASVEATAVGKYDMELKSEDFANTNANFAVTFGVTDGWLAITNGTILASAVDAKKVYDGAATNIAVSVTVPAEGAAVSFRTEEGEWTAAAEFAGIADAGTNKVWYLVEATGYSEVSNFAYVVIEPRAVEVEIVGHTNTVAFTGEPQSVEGYEVASEDGLYNADWIAFSGEASVNATAVGKYDMGLKAEDFANTNANFAVTFGVTDGWLAITNGTILSNAADAKKVYDGAATNITVSVTVPAEGAAVSFRTEDGEWTEAADFAGLTDAGTNKVWYLVEATGYTAVSNFAYVVIEPRAVEVEIAGHTNTVAFTGESQSVEGYEVAFEDELYNADWIDFSGEASVEATAVGKYDMELKSEDFANTNANFAVKFGVTDGWLAITNGTILASAVDAKKVYDGAATNIAVNVTVPAEGAAVSFRTEEGEWTAAAEFAGIADAGTNKVWYLVEATGYTAVSNFAYVVIEPRAVEVEIVGHTNMVAFAGEKQYVEGYEVAFEDDLYNADWIDFGGEASVAATAVGKYDMGLKAEDFANTNANFAVTFGVTDGWLEITVKPDGVYTDVVDGVAWTYTIRDGEALIGGDGYINAIDAATVGDIVTPTVLGLCPVTGIGSGAFNGCTGVTSVTISDGVKLIGTPAFGGCISLKSVKIPASVRTIEIEAFNGCSALETFIVDPGNENYSSRAGMLFNKDQTTLICWPAASGAVTIPNGVTCVALVAFEGCLELSAVTIPDTVTNIGAGAFVGCENLKSVYFLGNAPTGEVYGGITKPIVTSYVLVGTKGWDGNPESTAIPEMWPVGDRNARPIVAVARSCTVTFDLGGHAVRTGGGELTQTVAAFGAAVAPTVSPNVGYTFTGWSNAFDRVIGDTTVYAQYENVTPTDGTYSETVEGVTWNFAVMGGQIALGGGSNKKTAVPTSTSGTVRVPATLAGIPVTSLGRSAFDGCSGVTEVILPEGLLEVGSTAFRGCTSLRTVRFPASLLRISTSAFSGCKGLSELSLPEGLTAIGNYGFSFCTSLTSLSIPPSVTSLGASAFEGCRNLASIRFEGDVPQGLARSGLLDSARSVRYPSVYAAAYAAIVPAEIFAGYTDTKMVMLKSAANNRDVTVGDTWVSVDLSKRFGKGKVAEFKAKFGGDLAGALARPTGKIAADGRAMTVLDDYIAGTDPTDVNSTFKASIGVGEDGKPVVSWSPDLNENGAKAVRTYRVLGAKSLGEPWVEIPEGAPNDCTVFKVEVALPESAGAAMK